MFKIKNITFVIVFIFIILTVTGCQLKNESKEDVYLAFQKKVTNMTSYICKAEVTAINNKSQSNYIINHTYKNPSYYKLEIISPENLKGKTIEYYKDKIIIKNKKIDDSIELPNVKNERQYLFIGDFVQNYMQDENINKNLSDDQLILEAKIQEESIYFSKQILYVDKKTKNPVKMEILDKEGEHKFIVKYSNFEIKD